LLLLLALACVFIQSLPAAAHASLAQAYPPIGAVLSVAPSEVRLIFDDDLQDLGANSNIIEVTDPSGTQFQKSLATVEGATVVVPLLPLAPNTYTVTYRVVSADGHPVSSSYSFELLPKADSVTTSGSTPKPKSTPSHNPNQTTQSATPMPSVSAPSYKAEKEPSHIDWVETLGVAAGAFLSLGLIAAVAFRLRHRKLTQSK